MTALKHTLSSVATGLTHQKLEAESSSVKHRITTEVELTASLDL